MESKELELIRKAKAGDEEAKAKIISDLDILIKNINSKFGRTEDGYQEGVIATCNAINSFDEKHKVKFTTYVYRCVKTAIWNYIIKEQYKASLHKSRKARDNNLGYIENEVIDDLLEDKMFDFSIVESRIMLETLISKCDKLEQYIIKKIYFEGITEVELAENLKMSKQLIRLHKLKTLAKLRKLIKSPRIF